MGAVYSVLDRHRGEVIALKRLVASEAGKRALLTELFHQEFRTLVQLAHPHVVRAHDFGIDDQGPYYTMELLDGDDLHGLSPLPWQQACNLLRDVCSAIALLHSRRLLHRDLSPKNISVRATDEPSCWTSARWRPSVRARRSSNAAPGAARGAAAGSRSTAAPICTRSAHALTRSRAATRIQPRNASAAGGLWRRPCCRRRHAHRHVPAQLDALVMSLLSVDAVARPRSAAEVHRSVDGDRRPLRGRAARGLGAAYLTTPATGRRSAELARVRARLGEAIAGRARGGAPSKALPAWVARACSTRSCSRPGWPAFAVARASAGDATTAYGTVGALLGELRDIMPSTPVAVFEQGEISVGKRTGSRRAELHKALNEARHTAAGKRRGGDSSTDLERCDEPSQAATRAAAQASRRERVVIAATLESGAEARQRGAVAVVQSAMRIELTPLPPAVPRRCSAPYSAGEVLLYGLAARIPCPCGRQPGPRSVELAQHLTVSEASFLSHGKLDPAGGASTTPRCRAGCSRARPHEARRASGRRARARRSAHRGRGSGLGLEDLFPDHRERLRSILDELLQAHVLRIEGMHYAFEAEAWVEELCAGVAEERARAICLRVAQSLARRGRDRLDVARFLSRAG